MKYVVLICISIFMTSCWIFSVKGSKNYSAAIEDLDYNLDKEDLVLIKRKDFSGNKIFGNVKDTLSLKYGKRLFGIMDTSHKKIFVFKFFKDGTYTKYECDSTWKVQLVTNNMGNVY